MADGTETQSETKGTSESKLSVIDCDLHQGYRSREEIAKYLPDRYDYRGINLPTLSYANPGGLAREDSLPDDTNDFEYAGSSYQKIKENHLDKYDIDYAVLTGHSHFNVNALPNRDYAFELAQAHNKWLINEWLAKDERFLGSIHVAMQNPEATASMIREMGDHPRIVQITIQGVSGQTPLGHPYYWPIYEAAEDLGLPIALHVSSEGEGNTGPLTGAGYPNYYLEWHTLLPAPFMGQLCSLIAEGVFVEFPDLNFVLAEGGYTWLPSFMWRMDNEWKAVRAQTPWLERPPSEYIREHVWFTTQPVHLPDDPRKFVELLKLMNAEDVLLFSSDYPHWDADSPDHALPNLPDEMEERIYYKNAQELYGVPVDPAELPLS